MPCSSGRSRVALRTSLVQVAGQCASENSPAPVLYLFSAVRFTWKKKCWSLIGNQLSTTSKSVGRISAWGTTKEVNIGTRRPFFKTVAVLSLTTTVWNARLPWCSRSVDGRFREKGFAIDVSSKEVDCFWNNIARQTIELQEDVWVWLYDNRGESS